MKKTISVLAMSAALLTPGLTAQAQQTTENEQFQKINVEGVSLHTYVAGEVIRINGDDISKLDIESLIQKVLKQYGYKLPVPNAEQEKPETVKQEAPAAEEKPEQPKPAPAPAPEQPKEEKPAPAPEKPAEQKPEVEKPAAPAPAPAPQQPSQPSAEPAEQAPQQTAGLSAVEQKVLDLTNAERAKAGLKPLAADTKLMDAARAKSADMRKNNYFSHTSPTYGSPFDQMKAAGISYKKAAENIAMGQRTPEEVVKGWMESPGHRQNILTPEFTHIGIGYDSNGHYWTQMFIQK
ncbi:MULTISPECIES: CAP domain-containing protein [Bhargavaea]|uniref:CAP domain-containing protein n=1 Tax=Bhargavaea changchunensis TaxID=2134037 RepID=A0ABW2NG46_9BACL|nr:CAP domain-containing protein [Bhargavaea sp. CC-171006]